MAGSKGNAASGCGAAGTSSAPVFRPIVVRYAIGCALQFGWVPVACFVNHADWTALPLRELNPLAAFLVASALASTLSWWLFRSFDERPRWVFAFKTLALVLGVALAVLGSRPTSLGSTLLMLSFSLLGVEFALGAVMWERTLASCSRKEVVLVVMVTLTSFSIAFSLSAYVNLVESVVAAGVGSSLSMGLWKCGQLPAPNESLKRSMLLTLECRRLLVRYGGAFFLLGACSGIMLGLFASGIATPPELAVSGYAILGVAVLAAALAIGWLRKREFDFMFTFSLLMLFAVAVFFPINPGTKLNQHLSLILGESWMVVLLGALLLVSWVVDTLYARMGRLSIGLGFSGLLGGLSVGAVALGVLSETTWFCEVFRSSHDGIVFVTTCGASVLAVVYVCTNMLVNKNALRTVELLAKGRFVSSLPPLVGEVPETMGAEGEGAYLPGIGLTSRCRSIALEKGLTPREFEVLVVLAHGNSLARVQSELVISEGTAITHRRNIYRKLDVHSKQELLDFVRSHERDARSGQGFGT